MDSFLALNLTAAAATTTTTTSSESAHSLNITAESYQIPQLGFFENENSTFIFSSLRTFLSYITPNDVPVGMYGFTFLHSGILEENTVGVKGGEDSGEENLSLKFIDKLPLQFDYVCECASLLCPGTAARCL